MSRAPVVKLLKGSELRFVVVDELGEGGVSHGRRESASVRWWTSMAMPVSVLVWTDTTMFNRAACRLGGRRKDCRRTEDKAEAELHGSNRHFERWTVVLGRT